MAMRLRLLSFAAGLRPFFFAALICAALRGGSIEGRITNSVTGEPVIDATVRFIGAHSRVFSTSTDSTGTYHLTDLDEGDYRGEFSKNGFSDIQRGSIESILSGAGVAHVSGDTPVHVDAQLQPWGRLRGRVVDEEGNPAAGVTVEISRSVDNSAITDKNGVFGFEEVAPGSYTVVARPMASTMIRDGERVGTVPIYYPSATELADAISIPVRWGADVAGIEIRLKSVPVRRITGVVLDVEGKPMVHAEVKLLGRPGGRQYLGGVNVGPRETTPLRAPPGLSPQQALATMLTSLATTWAAGPGPEAEVANVESGEDGTFAFDAVQPGDWRLSVIANEDGPQQLTGVVSAAVGEKDVEGAQVRLGLAFFVEVTADWGDDATQKDGVQKDHPSSTMLSLAPLERQPPFYFDKSQTPPDIFPVLPGRYRVMGGNARAPGYYVASVTLGGAEVLGQVVELGPGSGPFRVSFKHDAGSVHGKAEKGEGASVFLVSREAGDLVHVRDAKCGAEGAFTFSGVPPGEYYVVAFDRVPGGGQMGSALPAKDLPASIVSLATSVRVEAGTDASVEVRVNAWPF
jgi:hypothetical protein